MTAMTANVTGGAAAVAHGHAIRWLSRALLTLLILLTLPWGTAAGARDSSLAVPVASAARIEGSAHAASFIAHLGYAIPFNVYVLANPYRVMIDLPSVDFRLSGNIRRSGGGLIRAVRYGRMDKGKARIVLDVDGPVVIRKSYIRHPQGALPARLGVELARTDEETFAALLAAAPQNDDIAMGRKPADDLPAITRAYRKLVEMASSSPSKPKPASIADLLESSPLAFGGEVGKPAAIAAPATSRRAGEAEGGRPRHEPAGAARGFKPLIVIDPGHGGKDPGAVIIHGGRKTTEKTLVLAFAHSLRRQLLATGKYRVEMTRDGDTFLPLAERARLASKHDAHLFISIHADKFRNASARGASIYTLSEKASDEEAAELARNENAVDVLHGVEIDNDNPAIRDILIDLTMRETKNHSIRMALEMAARMRKVTRMRPRPVRSAAFRVLRNPNVPSILIELGYMSNRSDVRNMTSKRWRRRMAAAMTSAIANYFSNKLAWR